MKRNEIIEAIKVQGHPQVRPDVSAEAFEKLADLYFAAFDMPEAVRKHCRASIDEMSNIDEIFDAIRQRYNIPDVAGEMPTGPYVKWRKVDVEEFFLLATRVGNRVQLRFNDEGFNRSKAVSIAEYDRMFPTDPLEESQDSRTLCVYVEVLTDIFGEELDAELHAIYGDFPKAEAEATEPSFRWISADPFEAELYLAQFVRVAGDITVKYQAPNGHTFVAHMTPEEYAELYPHEKPLGYVESTSEMITAGCLIAIFGAEVETAVKGAIA
ncbi:hypothetical protein AB1K91_02635 [Terribacillus sp. 179-K 1B1 HS]|uniref:hypothetical protein n=1 Tax=Terribacillus sp. 179-K 1B1 HS TaxID=3142388 RepID=UPI0039A3995A